MSGVTISRDRDTWSRMPHWVLFQASAAAVKLYCILHSYADNHTGEAWPSRATLAEHLGYAKPDSIQPYIKELEDLGAITVIRTSKDGMKAVNRYHVHHHPGTPVERGTYPAPAGEGTPVERGRVAPSSGHELDPLNYTQEQDPLFTAPAPQAPPAPATPPADTRNAQTLLGLWLDARGEAKPTARIKGQVAKGLKELLDEGIAYEDVNAGLANWHRDGRFGPSALANFVDEAIRARMQIQPMPGGRTTRAEAPRVPATTQRMNESLSLLSPEGRARYLGENPAPLGEITA